MEKEQDGRTAVRERRREGSRSVVVCVGKRRARTSQKSTRGPHIDISHLLFRSLAIIAPSSARPRAQLPGLAQSARPVATMSPQIRGLRTLATLRPLQQHRGRWLGVEFLQRAPLSWRRPEAAARISSVRGSLFGFSACPTRQARDGAPQPCLEPRHHQRAVHTTTSASTSATMDPEVLKHYLADSPPTVVPLAIKPHFEALNDQQKLYAHYLSMSACPASVRPPAIDCECLPKLCLCRNNSIRKSLHASKPMSLATVHSP